jgi:hypothetical protein
VAGTGPSATALSLLDSNPVSTPGVGVDRNENGRHKSSAAAAHLSRTPSGAGSLLLRILPILFTHSSSLLLRYLRKGQGFAEFSRLHGTVKTILGPGYVGVVMEKELGHRIRVKAGFHSHVDKFGCEGMFVWTHSDIKHSSRSELTGFPIYSPHWAFKPFVLLNYDSHHEFIEIAVPTSCLTRTKPDTHTPRSALHADVLCFTSHPQPQLHTPLPYPSRNAPTVSQPLATSGPVPLFQFLYDEIQSKIVQGMCHRASSTPRTDHRFSAAGYQEDTRLSSNPSCLLTRADVANKLTHGTQNATWTRRDFGGRGGFMQGFAKFELAGVKR